MKKTIICFMLTMIFIVSFISPANSDDSIDQDRNEIFNLWKQFEKTYNSGDAKALSDLWLADGDLFSLSGGIFRGKEEIEAFFKESLTSSYKESTFKLKIDSIRNVKADVVVVDGTWQVLGDALPQGYPTQGIYTQVLIKNDGKWKIFSARPSIPLQGHTRNHGR